METLKKKLLIIDDEPALIRIMGKFAEKLNWDAICVENGAKGIEALQNVPESFTAVIIDYNLPGEFSEEILVKLKQLNPELKCVLSTGFNADQISTQYKRVEIDKTLQKPFNLTDFKNLLDSL
ncbi:MAG: hypothetical protein DRO88_11040 [Promethearchaeia archaeon]|nr:MAG: hypothetical protein DRO88_11040 [Candidatus Lokiarchaeia archaeon]